MAGKTRSRSGSSQRSAEVPATGALRRSTAERGCSAGDGALLALDVPLAFDAVAREGQRMEPLLGDLLAAALALTEASLVELPERGDDVAEEPAIPAAELELELARVGVQGLIAQVLGRVVLEVLPVEDAAPDLVFELATLVDEPGLEVRELVRPHPRLHRERPPRPRRGPAPAAQWLTLARRPEGVQSSEARGRR